MQLVKQHDNLRMFRNAASITSCIGLDKILAVPVISLILTAESLSAQVRCSKDLYLEKCFLSEIMQLSRSSDRKLQKNTNKIKKSI